MLSLARSISNAARTASASLRAMSSASTATASSSLSLYLQKVPKQQPLKIAQIQQLKQEQQNITNLISSIQSLTIQKQATKVLGQESPVGILQVLNRSARNPKRANRGKRPVCRQARRAKRRRWGNHRRN